MFRSVRRSVLHFELLRLLFLFFLLFFLLLLIPATLHSARSSRLFSTTLDIIYIEFLIFVDIFPLDLAIPIAT